MRITLLGATGFVGTHLVPELCRRGHQCSVVCRNIYRCRAIGLVPGVDLMPSPKLTVEDLERATAGADAVINLVGILNESGRKGRGFHRVHVETVEKLVAACQVSGVRRYIQVSALNAGLGNSQYLISKGRAEAVLKQAGSIDATIVQPSVIFGEGDAFFNRFAGLLRFTPVLPLACPGALMQPVWVGDVVRAIGDILQHPETIGQTVELAGPNVYTLRQLVKFTAGVMGKRRWIIGLPDVLSRLQGQVMDWVPGKPFSSDNYKSLQIANISKANALAELGIRPRSIEAVVPAYLSGSLQQQRLDALRRTSGRQTR